MDDRELKAYEQPEVILELELEVRAGSPITPPCGDPLLETLCK